MDTEALLSRLEAMDREITLLSHILGVLVWDQESVTFAGIDERAQQMGLIESRIHHIESSDEMGDVLAGLGALEGGPDLDEHSRALVRERFRIWHRERLLGDDFVRTFAETSGKAHHVWMEARNADDYSLYEPTLAQMITLVRQKAKLYGYEDDPYDPLLDTFEPGTTSAQVERLFCVMEHDLRQILEAVQGQGGEDYSFLYQKYSQDKQELFARQILDAMKFDWNRGRLGVSAHPYTITLGGDDIRITTRYSEPNALSPLFSVMHEGGHALYEFGASQGYLKGTCLANAPSLGFHESQSRLWENMIGRSRSFWKYFYPRLKELFPTQLEDVDADTFFNAVNQVKPTCIRVDADEVTYGLHIILRFEIERQLLSGSLTTKDLPDAWNDGMERLLGIRPKSDREGVLQDVHWAMGELGYFPTYALGNLYAAQIYHAMSREIDVEAVIGTGDLAPIHNYLDEHIYRHGALYSPRTLLKRISGEDLDVRYYRNYLSTKYLGSVQDESTE